MHSFDSYLRSECFCAPQNGSHETNGLEIILLRRRIQDKKIKQKSFQLLFYGIMNCTARELQIQSRARESEATGRAVKKFQCISHNIAVTMPMPILGKPEHSCSLKIPRKIHDPGDEKRASVTRRADAIAQSLRLDPCASEYNSF